MVFKWQNSCNSMFVIAVYVSLDGMFLCGRVLNFYLLPNYCLIWIQRISQLSPRENNRIWIVKVRCFGSKKTITAATVLLLFCFEWGAGGMGRGKIIIYQNTSWNSGDTSLTSLHFNLVNRIFSPVTWLVSNTPIYHTVWTGQIFDLLLHLCFCHDENICCTCMWDGRSSHLTLDGWGSIFKSSLWDLSTVVDLCVFKILIALHLKV